MNIVKMFGTEVVHINTIELNIIAALAQIKRDEEAVLALIEGLE